MALSIDGRIAPKALVSVSGLANAQPGATTEATLKRSLTRAKVDLAGDGGALWAPVDHPSVQKWMTKAGVGDSSLYTLEGAAEVLKKPHAAIEGALNGRETLFRTMLDEPLVTLDEVRSVAARQVNLGSGNLARVARMAIPVAVGATAMVVSATRVAGSIEGSRDPIADRRTRRAGALAGAAGVGVLAGGLTALSVRRELPMVARTAAGVAAGGVMVGALAAIAVREMNANEKKD